MSRAAKERRFRRWRKYRQHCVEVTGQRVPLTMGMSTAWVKAVCRVVDGKFWEMQPWFIPRSTPYGRWEY